MSDNYFTVLNGIDVKNHIEKKGGFSYLSWPYAVAELRKRHPTATWRVIRFDGKPFLQTDGGCFVEVAVTVEGIELSQVHPVLDGRNKPILNPDAFQINTSLQRALVKAIALHGLGLYIYAGEDLPDATAATSIIPVEAVKSVAQAAWDALTPAEQKEIQNIADCVRAELEKNGAPAALALIDEQGLDNDDRIALASRFDSKERAALKAASQKKAA